MRAPTTSSSRIVVPMRTTTDASALGRVRFGPLAARSKPARNASQIDPVHAGKTMQIVLHDPGDVSGNAYLRILTPNGNAYNYANFSYTATNGLSGSNVNVIQTANGSSLFDNQQITIDIPLPANYGSAGLKPPGESEDGWWKIEYQVNGGNDTTTWQVSIRGSPVHLVVP